MKACVTHVSRSKSVVTRNMPPDSCDMCKPWYSFETRCSDRLLDPATAAAAAERFCSATGCAVNCRNFITSKQDNEITTCLQCGRGSAEGKRHLLGDGGSGGTVLEQLQKPIATWHDGRVAQSNHLVFRLVLCLPFINKSGRLCCGGALGWCWLFSVRQLKVPAFPWRFDCTTHRMPSIVFWYPRQAGAAARNVEGDI